MEDRVAQLIRQPFRKTLKCRDCAAVLRLYQLGAYTSIGKEGSIKHCPICGSQAVTVAQDGDVDYWEVLGESFSLPADVVQVIYEEWDPSVHHRFGDFIAELQNEIIEGQKTGT